MRGIFDHINYWGWRERGLQAREEGGGKTSLNSGFVWSFMARNNQVSIHSSFRASCETMKASKENAAEESQIPDSLTPYCQGGIPVSLDFSHSPVLSKSIPPYLF